MSKRDFTLIAAIIALMFLFWGEPDVFDALTTAARNWLLR